MGHEDSVFLGLEGANQMIVAFDLRLVVRVNSKRLSDLQKVRHSLTTF